jgi:predicted nuclease with TOPRIM domain
MRYTCEIPTIEPGGLVLTSEEKPVVLASDYDAIRNELSELKDSMAYRTSLVGRLESERDTLRTANQRLEGEVASLREALGQCLETMELFRITGQVYLNGKAALAGKGGDL